MSSDNSIREQGYQYFVTEAPELLQAIEQELFTLREEYSLVKVHSLMRTTHTLKGAAANMGLETIKTIAHHLEDVFKALYNQDLVIDTELEALIFEGYDCLRSPLMTQIQTGYVNDDEALERTVYVFAKLEEKLGDYFGRDTQIPSSVELGFDITKSIFEVGVKQRLEELATILEHSDAWEIESALKEQAEIFIGLAESLNLPGFGAIAQKTLAALELHPQQVLSVAKVAITDFWQAWSAVIAGDRTVGGEPSFSLQQLAGTILPSTLEKVENEENLESPYSETEPILSNSIIPETEPILELENEVDIPEISLEPTLEDVFGGFVELTETIEAISEPITLETEEEKSNESSADIPTPKPEEQIIVDTSTLETDEQKNLQTQDSKLSQSPVASPPSAVPNSVKVPRQTVRVDVELLERLSHLAGELLISQNRLANIAEQLQESVGRSRYRLRRHQQTISHLRDWSDQLLTSQERRNVKVQVSDFNLKFAKDKLPSQISNLKLETNSHFDSLELDQYNELHVLLQAVLEEMVQLEETVDSTDLLARQSNQIIEKQRRLLNNVQDDMREARMLPVGEIFNRFPRVLQQLATSHQKKVELTLHGRDVLVDRALAEKLYDPLLHLVRNAFDHGIESPQIRASRGKPETGIIEISAYHRGNQTIIEVCDDGDGINPDRIRRRAIEMNWFSAEKVNNLSESALLDLLFEPGFSTASQVSELSGRGIGLNVVRSQLEALGGSVSLHSEPGRGTLFSLHFPLTLTMAKLMVCESGGAVYALLSDAIEQIIIPKSDQIQRLEGQKVLRWNRGNVQSIVPVYNMSELLGSPSPAGSLSSPLILLKQERELLGLEVDQIVGEQELVIRPLGKAIAPPSYIYGGSNLADGRLTLVIDGNALVNHLLDRLQRKVIVGELLDSEPKDRQNYLGSSPAPSLLRSGQTQALPLLGGQDTRTSLSSVSPKILVVDDSISLRQTLALMLQKAGYQVAQAQNGREALQQLHQNPGIQIVICDIEMPLMNGFEFLNHCRHEMELSKIPVVMLTSRSGEKHRMLALEMGAMGYFTKPYREDEILIEIGNLLKSKSPALVSS